MAERVEDVLHEAFFEWAAQADAYLATFAHHLSPGMGRQPLKVLFRIKRMGPLRELDLAAQLRLGRVEADRHVADLVERGLVERDGPGPQAVVRLTDRALEPLDLAEHERRGRILDALESWSLEDKETFARLLSKFVQRDDLVVRSLGLFDRR